MRIVAPSPSEVAMLARLTRDLPRFLRTPITPEQAAAIVRRRLATRAERFLDLAGALIYDNPRSPYLRLLRMAGCEAGDLRALVAREGLEGALQALAGRGVYLDLEEFKGRRQVVRGSVRFAVVEAAFDNPRFPPHFERRTGGTQGPRGRVPTSLASVTDLGVRYAVALAAHRLADADYAVWMTAPVLQLLRAAKLGRPPIAWFHPVAPLHPKVRLVGTYLRWYGRLLGRPFPRPIHNDVRDGEQMARWLAARLREGRRVCLTGYASSCVRAAEAADGLGLVLEGAGFICIGEPFTRAKLAAIEAVRARAVASYSSTEAGMVAVRCAATGEPDDLHVFEDSYALIRRPRPLGDGGPSVEALHVTSLLPAAPKILLNVDLGDHGELGRRACGCPLGTLGLDLHLSEVRSHEKLTSEGMTFARTSLLPLLEEVLPARFGGSAADYQLWEEEASEGILRLSLLVHPRLGPLDEAELTRAFLAELAAGGLLEGYMARVWEQAGTVRVRREPPRATAAGKVLPFQAARHALPR